MGRPDKRIRAAQPSPKHQKVITTGSSSGSVSSELFQWDVKWMDADVSDDDSCPWTWRLDPTDLKVLLTFLVEMSNRTWGEIEADRTGGRTRHKKHHDMEVADLDRCAQSRFSAHISSVTDDSYDTVFRLRYAGEKRVWGVRDRSLFKVIWSDLNHGVYPVD